MRIGQKIKDERIGTLSHNAGIISLTSSTVNIGGIQVDTDALSRQISLDVPTMSANTLYMIYVAMLTGTPVMRISVNVNSVGPAGFISWKLVGAFYSDGTSTPIWGAFVNIEGVPVSPEIFGGLARLTSSGGFLTKGTTTLDYTRWSRIGDKMKFVSAYQQTTAGSGGSGNLYCTPPLNITIDDSKWAIVSPQSATRGSGYVATTGDGRHGTCWSAGSGGIGIFYSSAATNTIATLATHSITNTGWSWSMDYMAVISGWSNTPLKDL